MSGTHQHDVVLVTCDHTPWSDAQRDALEAEFAALHCEVVSARWDDDIDWAQWAGAVVVSPFGVAAEHERFLAWLHSVAETSVVVNDASILAAGSHRRYLFDLESAGVPIVATRQIAQHAPWQFQRAALRRFDGRVVIKPAVGSDRFAYGVFDANSEDAFAHLEAIAMLGDVIVQPYISTADTVGVSQIVVLGGEISHAVRHMDGVTVDHTVQPEEREIVAQVLDVIGVVPVAMGVDLVWVGDRPAVLSCDLVGPNLHAEASSPALRRFARLAIDTIHAPRIDGVVAPQSLD